MSEQAGNCEKRPGGNLPGFRTCRVQYTGLAAENQVSGPFLLIRFCKEPLKSVGNCSGPEVGTAHATVHTRERRRGLAKKLN